MLHGAMVVAVVLVITTVFKSNIFMLLKGKVDVYSPPLAVFCFYFLRG